MATPHRLEKILCCLTVVCHECAQINTSAQAGLRTLHEAGPELQRTISTDLEAMLAAEQMIEDEQMTTTTRRQQSSLFGALQTEFKRATSPEPRQKKLASDLSDLPTE